jgi:predicted NUDIX family NTP pyrophosphohydrolase
VGGLPRQPLLNAQSTEINLPTIEKAPRKHPARKKSAGLLLYRSETVGLEVLLVHPGGPFWQRKDEGAWSIPKGEIDEGEDELAAARREFSEETGYTPKGTAHDLGSVRQPSGKDVHVWAVQDDWDATRLVSNTFDVEWPPHSGHTHTFPEVDKAAWFDLDAARTKILKGQIAFLDRLVAYLAEKS